MEKNLREMLGLPYTSHSLLWATHAKERLFAHTNTLRFAEKHPTSTSHSSVCTEEIWFTHEGALKTHSQNGCAQTDPFCPLTEAKGSAGTTDVLVTPPWGAAAVTLAH